MKKTAAKSYQLPREARGEHAPSQEMCEQLVLCFKSGDFDIADKEHRKIPIRYKVVELQALLDNDYSQKQHTE